MVQLLRPGGVTLKCGVLTGDDLDIARVVECHEAEAWAACVDAASAIAGNPLLANVDRSITTPLSTVAAFNFGMFNRVIALGVGVPASERDIDLIMAFYESHAQSRFLIEVTPASRPETLAIELRGRGLVESPDKVAKCWRGTDDIPDMSPAVEVRELTVADREQWSAVNVSAWQVPRFFGQWFGATLGRSGFRHYGIFVDDQIVSTGAIYVSGDVAWSGFSATRPEHRGHRYQIATHIQRLRDAAEMGCRLVHTETAAETPERPNPSLHNQMRVGFDQIYEKTSFTLGGSA